MAAFAVQAVTVGLALAFIVVWWRPDLFARGEAGDVASYAEAVARAAPAVVNIHTARRVAVASPLLDDPFDLLPAPGRIETSLGSGVIVDPRGYILTNHHVIADADGVQVALADGRVVVAELVGTDPETDLALLRVAAAPLPAIDLARVSDLRVGDVVLAIGNPYGFGQTVTQGIVSATGRNHLGLNTFENFIQTDAAINPGSSGGALVNARGELVGINSVFYGGSQGIGFAIPADLARGVMTHLLEHGRVLRGFLGVEPQDLTAAERLGLPDAGGVLVAGVYRGSPAADAGIRPGDVITRIDDAPVGDARDALNRIARLAPGTEITLEIVRDGERSQLAVVVGERASLQPQP